MMMGGLLKLLLDGWEGWHAIRKIFNLILKVRYPAISSIIGWFTIDGDHSNEFKHLLCLLW